MKKCFRFDDVSLGRAMLLSRDFQNCMMHSCLVI